MAGSNRHKGSGFRDRLAALFLILVASLFLNGCASRHYSANRVREPELPVEEWVAAAIPPFFLTGPAAVVLTNGNDYSAHLELVTTNAPGPALSGNLFQQEGNLLFVPKMDEIGPGSGWTGTFRFLWNVRQNRGFVISESLRAFVPVDVNHPFSVGPDQTVSGSASSVQLDGQACDLFDLIVLSELGKPTQLRVWRDRELLLPLQVQSTENHTLQVLHLSQLNGDRLPPDLFLIPQGFSRYASAEAMVRELRRKPRIMPYSHDGDGLRHRSR